MPCLLIDFLDFVPLIDDLDNFYSSTSYWHPCINWCQDNHIDAEFDFILPDLDEIDLDEEMDLDKPDVYVKFKTYEDAVAFILRWR